ncbi:hypothetical protein GCM10018775_45940 [Streptomyces umbrinus]|nr:hypothetical protein GCM10018775_45940 [Streptomyces umbrinus]
MSEGYEGHSGTVRRRPDGLFPPVPDGPSSERLSDHAVIPFLGHAFRVSGFLRDELHARRAAPDGWIRHA